MPELQIELIPCLQDNYAVLLHDAQSSETALVDAPEAAPILARLEEKNWRLSHIFITHHHFDHVSGLEAIKAKTGAKIFAPEAEAEKIAVLDEKISDGEQVDFAGRKAEAILTPGHTLGQIAWWFERDKLAFTGDTLFVLGCGRVFEGTPEMMWQSLNRLAQLPDDTIVYCGHEYTLSNARFALSVDANNAALQQKLAEIEEKRAQNLPTLPTSIGEERKLNPFLRADEADLQAALGMVGQDAPSVFSHLRTTKDNF